MLLLFVVVIQYQVKYSGVSFMSLVLGLALRALLFLLSRSLRIDGHHGDFIDVNWEEF